MAHQSPPALPGPAPSLIDACVHCGFCLPACPTYLVDREEADSPRGRIYLMKAVREGRMPFDAQYVAPIDHCLGCLGCVTACPSGVKYDQLIESARAEIATAFERPAGDRWFRSLLFAVLPFPGRLRMALPPLVIVQPVHRLLQRIGLTRGLPARLRALLETAPQVSLARLLAPAVPERTPARSARRAAVGLLAGCAQRVLFAHVNQATVRVLAAEGCDVSVPRHQGCCGALSLHAGRLEEARAFARQTIDTFDRLGVDRVVTNAAGCGSALKEYGALLAGDAAWAARAQAFSARVADVSECLAGLGPPQAVRHPIARRVVYQDACHLAHAQGIRREPRDLLAAIPGVTLAEAADADVCCGSAGIYNLLEPDMARKLGQRKLATIEAVAPDLVASANPGCALQIAAAARREGRSLTICHPIELLDASIRGATTEGRAGREF